MDLNELHELPPWDWPNDAGERLAAALLDEAADPANRRLAAELAGNITVASDDLAQALLGIIRSPENPPELRATAAISLGPVLEDVDLYGFDDDLVEPPVSPSVAAEIGSALRAVYTDAEAPTEARRSALEASVRAPEAWHDGAVRAAYHSGDAAWRRTAVFCMGFVDGFEEEILEALESEDPEVRFEAVRSAGHQAVGAAWSRVRAILRTERSDKVLILAAIDAAASIRFDDPDGLAEALGELPDSDDEEIADAALEALMMAEGEWGPTGELKTE